MNSCSPILQRSVFWCIGSTSTSPNGTWSFEAKATSSQVDQTLTRLSLCIKGLGPKNYSNIFQCP